MTARDLLAAKIVASGAASIATVTTTNLDFGTPDDVKLAFDATKYASGGDRLLAVVTLSTSGTTDATSVSIQDAPDNAGSIGTPATATTGTIPAGAAGNQYLAIPIRVKSDRPWIRVRVTRASGTTDTTVARCVLLAIPAL